MSCHINTKRGFTLVELLVVLAIIAIVISILMPSINMARKQAERVVCASHMRQIVSAQLVYAADNKSCFGDPPAIWTTWSDGIRSPHYMYYMESIGILRYDVGSFWPYLSAGCNRMDPTPGVIGRGSEYLRRIMTCPSDTDEIRNSALGGNGVDNAGNNWVRRNYTYSWNVLISYGVGGLREAKKLGQVKDSSNKIILVEEAAPNDGLAYLAIDDMDDTPNWIHNGRSNYGFADGHVMPMYPVDLGYTPCTTQMGRSVLNPDPNIALRRKYYFDLNPWDDTTW